MLERSLVSPEQEEIWRQADHFELIARRKRRVVVYTAGMVIFMALGAVISLLVSL